jgi:hypothetical protein
MSLAGFAESVEGFFVAGCLIATVDGTKQYLHRDGEFTPKGREMYEAWERQQQPVPVQLELPFSEPEPNTAIAATLFSARPKQSKRGGVKHGG